MSFYIIKDTKRDNIRATRSFVLPMTGGPSFPPNSEEAIGGGLLYDNITKLPFYNNGQQWLPLTGGSGSTVNAYALVKNGDQIIAPSVDTIISSWNSSPSPYHDQTSSWNLSTGVYTANIPQSLMVSANITWGQNFTTIGRRFLQIIYKPAAGSPVIAKEAVTQPDPNVDIKTTQEATMVMKLSAGDQVWVQVIQTSNTSISIAGGNETSLSGFQTF